MTKNTALSWISFPNHPLLSAVQELLRVASEVDGIDPLSEQFLLGLADASLQHRHLLAVSEGQALAVAAVAKNEAELAVHPQHRGRGWGRRLIDTLRAEVPELAVWAHGNLPGAQALAQRYGAHVVRRLLVLGIEGAALEKAARLDVPAGYEELSLADSAQRWGREQVENAWLKANNEAFEWHPEQGGWDEQRLARAMSMEWFDPEDVRFLWSAGKQPAELAGFHWTKWHSETTAEVYVVGLADAFRGQGLGKPTVAMGLQHLLSGGAKRVILYVEDDNKAAVERYRQDGFVLAEEHVVYSAAGKLGSA